MKARILVDLVLGFSHVLPEDNKAVLKIGRGRECDIKTSGKERGRKVSKYHACIVNKKGGNVYIWDTNSKNGTYIQRGKELIRVYEQEIVNPGEKIYLGNDYIMELRIEDLAAKESAESRERQRETQTDKIISSKTFHHQTR